VDAINEFITMLNQYIGSKGFWFPYVLLFAGMFFTFYLKFPQIRFFRHAIRIVTGKYEKESFQGDTTHFQSLATALSGTVGTGNIGGVALALYIGGPAALFWMWTTAFFGMTLKFVECTLSHKYREIDNTGAIAGGPMYYMKNKLNIKWMATLFAIATILCTFGTGNMPQINNIASSVQTSFNIRPWITGAVLSVLLFLIIIGGIKRIAKWTEKIVPTMAIIYVAGALLVISTNYANIIPSFKSIFVSLFSGSAALGGFLGASFSFAFTNGVGQGIFSNEAGQGSAAIAHSAAKADEPVSEGMVSILEPFIDTLVICTLTGLTILASGVWIQKHDNIFQRADLQIIQGIYQDTNSDHVRMLKDYVNNSSENRIKDYNGNIQLENGKINGTPDFTILHARSVAEEVVFYKNGEPVNGTIQVSRGKPEDSSIELRGRSRVHSAALTTRAFTKSFIGDSGKYIVTIGLLLFAFSTVISWSYYGDRAVTYLMGAKYVVPYRYIYVGVFFVGALTEVTIVWSLAAIAIVIMSVPNLVGIMILHKDMKQSIVEYWKKFKKEHPEDAAKIKVKELKK
jgi:AGCS family alanine or glycine:cation symporter